MINSGTILTRQRGQELAARRHFSALTCSICGSPMVGIPSRRRYCSAACSLQAYRRRKHLASSGSNGGGPGNTGAASGPPST